MAPLSKVCPGSAEQTIDRQQLELMPMLVCQDLLALGADVHASCHFAELRQLSSEICHHNGVCNDCMGATSGCEVSDRTGNCCTDLAPPWPLAGPGGSALPSADQLLNKGVGDEQ